MQNEGNHFPQDVYSEHLENINHINFTPREIDIIAFIISGRSTKKIASFLSISPKTVENHIRNIMIKLKCNSRESVIDFIEKSGKFSFVKKYHASLLSYATFEKSLKKIALEKGKGSAHCLIVHNSNRAIKKSFVHHLEAHLMLAGVEVSLKNQEKQFPLSHLPHEVGAQSFIIYVFSEEDLKSCQSNPHAEDTEIFSYGQETAQYPNNVLFLLGQNGSLREVPKELSGFDYRIINQQTNYYFLVFDIIKKLFPSFKLEDAVSEFKENGNILQNSWDPMPTEIISGQKSSKNEDSASKDKTSFLTINKKWVTLSVLLILGLVEFGFLAFNFKGDKKERDQNQYLIKDKESQAKLSIRSDLALPTESIFLNRSKLITQIDNVFKKQREEIQTVTLVGIGGSGKTTLAHQYVRTQKLSLVWEINAETKESLLGSFENLAYALSKTEEEKKILKGLQEIKDSKEREKKIILFVKEKLKSHSNWFLIYDNVEKFSEVQKYFPSDPDIWGRGKVILTTRDDNIQNIGHANAVIKLGELNQEEKLTLFIKILNNMNADQLTSTQKEQTINFLNEIPPFPLDVSVAAYYLKMTNVPYKKYLEYMKNYNKDFTDIQESVLRETGGYAKTRYSIITLSLKQLIETHKDFGELLLFISLLDSQNIPRVLLNNYKSDVIVDKFIQNLKKYSLIVNEPLSSLSSISTISIHKNTQEISLIYLIKTLKLKKNNQTFTPISHHLENYIKEVTGREDFVQMRFLVNHCERFLSHSELLSDCIIESIHGELGSIYLCLGNYKVAQNLIKGSLTSLNKRHNQNHPLIPRFLTYLGNTYRDLGDFKKAKNQYEESLRIYNRYFPKHYVDIAWTLSLVGAVSRVLGDYNCARDLLEKSLAIYDQSSSKDRTKIAYILKELGTTYKDLGYYTKAKELLEQSLALLYQEDCPKDSDNYTWVGVSLGNVYRELGDYKKARELLEQSLISFKKFLPENHQKIAGALRNLGNVYKDLGDYKRAKDLLEQSLVIYENDYPEDQLRISWGLQHLGNVYRRLGDYKRAKELLEKSFSIQKAVLGEDNVSTNLYALYYVGNIYIDLGFYKEAKDIFEKCLVVYEKHYKKEHNGKDHIKITRVLRSLAKAYFKEGDAKIAEKILHRCLEIFQKNSHPHIYMSLEDLAELHEQECLKAMKLGNTLEFQNRKNRALLYIRQALNTVKNHFPKDSPHIIRIQSKLEDLQNLR